MEQLERKRAAARGWTTRAAKALQDLLADPNATRVQLEDAVQEFDKRLATLDNVQAEVELEISDPDLLEADLNKADSFRSAAKTARIQAAQKFADLDKAAVLKSQSSKDSDSNSAVSACSSVKLPRLELPKFSGELTQWQSFWDLFAAMVDDSSLPAISKFTYLQSLLEGEAKSVIQGLSLTALNYTVACKLLKERFGKPERIIFAHIQALLCLSMPSKPQGSKYYVSALRKMQDELQTHIRSLEALGVSGDEYGLFLTPVILSRLPGDIRLEWSREGSGHESDLAWLMTFLTKEIERRERSDSFKDVSTTSGADNRSVREFEKRKASPSSASALQSLSETSASGCGFCNKFHASEKCFKVLQLSPAERQEKIRSAELCFVCLKKGHISKGCKARCVKCKGNHNVLLCSKGNFTPKGNEKINVQATKEGESESGSATVKPGDLVSVAHSSRTPDQLKPTCSVLPTAKVKVYGKNGMCSEATLLFDSGSDKSYVSSKFVRKVRPTWVSSEQISYSSFGGSKCSKSTPCNIYDVNLLDVNGGVMSLLAVEVPSICAPLFRPRVPAGNQHAFKSIQFADEYVHDRELTVDILVGLDAYWKFMIPNTCLQAEGLVAQETVFGWVLSGTCSPVAKGNNVFSQMLCINSFNEDSLHKFWDLESVGICHTEVHSELPNNPVLKSFSETVKYKDGRYEVALPWKSINDKHNLQNNEKLARKRLSCLMHKFKTNPTLQEEYDAVLKGYEQEGIIEEVPENEMSSPHPMFYLPHRPVIREVSTTSKVRPVFDASAVSYNGISLNHCLESGPSLNPLLVEVLVRFRRWKVALTGDITKAFLQINVRKEDRDAHRFLWDINGNIRTMRFARVPFGNKSSPFLLNATVKHHLKSFPTSEVVAELQDNLYVDDWLSGADSAEEAFSKFNEACSVLSKASLSLSKWNSNCKSLTDKFSENLEPSMHAETKVLGLQWCLTEDSFSFGCLDLRNHEVASTKRAVLSVISKVFDPLGLVSPVTMRAKILFQDIWRLGLSWDEALPADLLIQFQKWIQDIKILNSWQVHRCYFPDLSWKKLSEIELHTFGDASEKGYGACVYLRVPGTDGSYRVSLVLSRGRVAPVKKVSVPRLELMGALLCARQSVFVKSALQVNNVQMYCWTDSKVVLSWIKGDPNRWKTFVANRVTEIQSLVPPVQWHHIPGRDNPADIISRGAFAEDFISCTLWLNGPAWLSEHSSILQNEADVTLSTPDELLSNSGPVSCLSAESSPVGIDFSRCGNFTKALNCFAWVLRFVNNCKPLAVKISGPLSYKELEEAKIRLFFCVQREKYTQEITALTFGKSLPKGSAISKFNPFLDDSGLLRSKGRLDQADISYDSKHPLILPSGHIAKLLVSFQHKFLKHAGVSTLMSTLRSCYLIVGLRKLAKTVCRECTTCRRHHSQACQQPVAPLPGLRVNSAPPFTVTGVDYAGPMFCVDFPSKKHYILLFTCGVVRALHLELTDSMSHDDCLLALRRFCARRGLPSVIYSDNAKTFISMSNQLQQVFGTLAPQWKFIVPHAPWWGGWWERLVRSVKLALRKTLGIKCLTRCELETTLHEVEACINSRPLTFAGEDPDYSCPLTPSHFLIGRTAGFQLQLVDDQLPMVSSKDLREREGLRQQLLDKFWRLWVSDYLLNLPSSITGFVPRCNLKKGSVVLIRDDKTPRLHWPLGVVVELFPGKDGIVRSVNVKTSKGVICRPVQRLHNLELYSAGSVTIDTRDTLPSTDASPAGELASSESPSTSQSSPYVSRSGRIVKPPNRLGI